MKFRAILLDLDGTLADTAPDLVAVLNELLSRHKRSPAAFAIARNEVSNGAVGLIRLGFGAALADDELESLRQEFLAIYMENICINTKIFREFHDIFNNLNELQIRWGIVTNKPAAMTDPLLDALKLPDEPACVISGDRLPQRKPHPAPLLLAADELDLPATQCIYVGDAERDIEAGRAAGMATIAVTYGYIRPHQDPYSWGADIVVRRAADLLTAIQTLESDSRFQNAP